MSSGNNAAGERIRVMIADDSHPYLELQKSFFPESEYEVTLARNGCDAYNLAKVVEPAVVFLDLFMPLVSGEECCRLIKGDPHLRNTRVVLVAPDDEQLLRCCRDAPCDLVLTKPVERGMFIGAVQALVWPTRRAAVRWPLRIAAELHDDHGFCLRTWSVNLSDKGGYLESTEMLPMGRPYTLHLETDYDEPLVIPMRIAWHNSGRAPCASGLPSGFGVHFTGLSAQDGLRLRKLIDRLAESGDLPKSDRRETSRLFVELPMMTGKKL